MGKPILITGASRGLGAALAEAIAPDHHVIAVARTIGGLEDLDDRIIKAKGGSATLAPLDLTDAGAVFHLVRSVQEKFGGIAGWFHTAIQAAPLTPAHHIFEKDWTKAEALNTTGTARMIAAVAPLLDTDGFAAFFDDPNKSGKFMGAYGPTKTAQIALAQNWAVEAEKNGPKVHVLTPPPMPTALRARFYPGEDRAALTQCAQAAAQILDEIGLK
ncbi:MAG: SDR family NAD(P)-dependent oxidoreductase [Planktomarina sp.]